MVNALFEKRTFGIMKQSLNADMKRHDLIANNIANVNTPGFKRSDIVFSRTLAEALNGQEFQGKKTRAGHVEIGRQEPENVRPSTALFDNTSMRNDDNNVDVDKEMAELAKTQLHFNAMVQGFMGEASKISNVISKGGR